MLPAPIGRREFAAESGALEAFELVLGPAEHLVHRLAAASVARDHLRHDRLQGDLRRDQRRRRRADDAGLLVATLDRIVRQRALGWSLFVPGLEVVELHIGWEVVALARRHLLLGILPHG